ncbi:alpha/beta fold hydrolase [Polynucleobacter kasalickyi]|uniref:Homoserine O-acetyltransferase n=1 Tax=Polynucleobacter kasalickyi TaxID=1938817 RepID=A0A1W1YNS5_9BURK|nr:alpha/beta fold hydrolase [Polynucleobacter kasalickyi]SMC37461.1 homoserine O-acetyltransferase [Polynucleobacter kasalickyi]
MRLIQIFLFNALILLMSQLQAQEFYAQKSSTWSIKNFQFHNGQVLPELKLSYITLGNPSNPAVLVLHGTAGTAKGMLNPSFGGELFGPGQVLDASKYFIILTDAIGAGNSSKPSDGLRAKFPSYNYDDMVKAQHAVVTEGLGIQHLKLVMGNSMGGMQTWLWGTKYPEMMDLLMPMASSPAAMSGRNWMMRKFIVDSIRQDPSWLEGNYKVQPFSAKFATTYFSLATSGGHLGLQRIAPTSAKGNEFIANRLKDPNIQDANDLLYQWQSSEDFNPEPDLDKIKAKMLIINSADDERNPPELGKVQSILTKLKSATYYLIPASEQTSGHSTTGQAKWWKAQLSKFLE